MIPVFRPYLNHSEILGALRLSGGRSEFESALATRVGARYGIAFAYGRSAIFATLKALGLTQAEVILPAYTCQVVAEAVVLSGNQPVFVDIDLADYNMDINAIKAALTSQARAIIATHMYGYPADVDAIRAVVGDAKVIIIEDSAQLGPAVSVQGRAGLRGDVGVFSFGVGKHLYTVQGGVVVTNSPELFEKIKIYRDREMSQLSPLIWSKRWARLMIHLLRLNEVKYELRLLAERLRLKKPISSSSKMPVIEIPSDYAAAYTNLQGQLGLAQLRKFDSIVAQRRALAKFYDSELRDIPGFTPAPIVADATYAFYTPRLKRRDEIGFRQQMRARRILIGLNYSYVLPLQKPYRLYARSEYPCAEQAACEIVNLPSYAGLSMQEARYVVECIQNFAKTSMVRQRVAQTLLNQVERDSNRL
jgi:perosamine synthetase